MLTRRRLRFLLVLALCVLAFLSWLRPYEHLHQTTLTRVPKLPTSFRVFIAANLYNSQEILEQGGFIQALLQLIHTLGGAPNVFVSIYENGSQDRTKDILLDLKRRLTVLEVPHQIHLAGEQRQFDRRIPYLAEIRNRLLEPLQSPNRRLPKFDKILFLNDIQWTAEEALRLLTSRSLDYDAVCAMDFQWWFYDTFATRELPSTLVPSAGEPQDVRNVSSVEARVYPPSALFPYFRSEENRRTMLRRTNPTTTTTTTLLPVYSCWNGMLAMNAAPFQVQSRTAASASEPLAQPLQFRSLFPERPQLPYEASECCLIFSDLHQRGHHRVFIDPDVRVAYAAGDKRWADDWIPLWNWYWFGWRASAESEAKPSDLDTERYRKAWDAAEKDGVSPLDLICVQP